MSDLSTEGWWDAFVESEGGLEELRRNHTARMAETPVPDTPEAIEALRRHYTTCQNCGGVEQHLTACPCGCQRGVCALCARTVRTHL